MNLAISVTLAAALAAGGDAPAGVHPAAGVAPPPAGASTTQLVQFSSQRCPHCKTMQPILAELARQGVPVQVIDVDQQAEIARQFAVPGVPTFVAIAGGRETGRIVGATSYEKLVELIKGQRIEDRSETTGPSAASPTSDHGPPTSDHRPLATDAARAATVRIKVEDATGYGFGTGTVIDTHEHEALVVTCGHLFRESKGQGKITADLFSAGTAQTVDGQLIAYDLDRDIALVSLRAGPAVRPAMVAPPGYAVRPGDRAFTIGCDKGADPTIRFTHITAVNKYQGKPNFTAAGQPVDGRSGGGLFSADGYLIGICNAADPADDEGLYAGLPSIHWQLDRIGQSEVYQRAARLASTAGQPPASPAPPSTGQGQAQVAAAHQPRAPMHAEPPRAGQGAQPVASAPGASPALNGEPVPVVAAGDDTEIVFIVRSKRDPAQRSEVFVVDGAPPDLLARITHAARMTGEHRAALARAATPRPPTSVPPAGATQVVRGQSTD